MSEIGIAVGVGAGIILIGLAARTFFKPKDDNVYNSMYAANVKGQNPDSYSNHAYDSSGFLRTTMAPSIGTTLGGKRRSKSKKRKTKK